MESGGPWSWLSRVSRVKFSDILGGMTEFGHEYPRCLFISAFITSPSNQVEEATWFLASLHLGIKDLGNLVLNFAVYFDRQRGWLDSVQYFVWSCRFEHCSRV